MFGGLLFIMAGLSASVATNLSAGTGNSSYFAKVSPRTLYAECPNSYSKFCYHGTCRFVVTELEASCICFDGYMGHRCEYANLLQVMSADPRSIIVVALAVTVLLVLSLISSTCLGLYFCRLKRERTRLRLLKNVELNDANI